MSAQEALPFATIMQHLNGKAKWMSGAPSTQLSPPGRALGATFTPLRHAPFASFSLGKSILPGSTLRTKYAHDMKDLAGTWVKDKDVSDSMKPAMDLMALGGIVRQAVKLVRGIKIEQNETTWTMAVFSVIAWFKVTERYPLDGGSVQCKRRDLRRGKHTGKLLPGQPGPHGGLMLSLEWDEPHGGTGTDEFVLAPRGTAAAEKAVRLAAADPAAAAASIKQFTGAPEGEQELHVYSNMVVDAKPCGYRTIYHRK